MALHPIGGDEFQLTVSLEQLKRIYTALYCRVQTGGCNAFADVDQDDLLLTLQTQLHKQAAAQGVDCLARDEWETFLGITHPASCPRKHSDRAAAAPEDQQG